jgi:predicted RNA-binding protein YlxR (DUF448 family)
MKHVPLRTCVACREAKPKRELVRIVRVADGLVEVDSTGKKNGRGSYLCPAQECWRLAEKRRALNHALEMNITTENWAALWSYAEGLPELKVLKRAERESVETGAERRDSNWHEQTTQNRVEADPQSKSPRAVAL